MSIDLDNADLVQIPRNTGLRNVESGGLELVYKLVLPRYPAARDDIQDPILSLVLLHS